MSQVILTYTVATSLAGGELFSGIVLTLSLQCLASYGMGKSILHDKDRQKILSFICFIGGLTTMLSNSFNATGISVPTSDATVFIGFLCVRFGLVILNHNTIVRSTNLLPAHRRVSRKVIDTACCFMYCLPILALVPIYLAFKDKAGTGQQVLATLTDILLMRKVLQTKEQVRTSVTKGEESSKEEKSNKPYNLKLNYGVVWVFTLLDIALKVIIICGQAFLFDTNIALAALVMRARTNLLYGLEMQSVFGHARPSAKSSPQGSKATSSMTSSV